MKTMDSVSGAERECTLLGTLFQYIITDLKSSSPAWDDVVSKGFKLHNLVKSSASAMSGFIEAIQKIADSATNSKGSTKDVGTALTRICVRQKMVENKLKQFTNALMDSFLNPVQEKVEEWKKTTTQLEKDHTREYKRATSEIKKRNSDTMRLQKKAKKASRGDVQFQINAVKCDVNERFTALEETEKAALRNLLVEERSRICQFANYLSPVLNMQVSMLHEVDHLKDLTADMENLCRNPMQLPTSTEQLIQDFIAANDHLAPPPETQTFHHSANNVNSLSPTHNDNRRFSSFSSNLELPFSSHANVSLNRSATLRSRQSRPLQFQEHRRTNSGGNFVRNPDEDEPPTSGYERLSSVSSRDSGFISAPGWEAPSMTSQYGAGTHQTFKNPFPTEQGSYKDDDSVDSTPPSPPQRKDSRQSPDKQFSWKDWKIPGPYEIHNVVPVKDSDFAPTKTAPPPISPKPTTYREQPLPVEPPQEKIPSRPRSVNKSSFCYALPPTRKNHSANKPNPDPEDDPLPPPPPALLETNSAVNTTIVPPGEQFYHHNAVARAPSPQFPLSQYTHEGAVSSRPNSKYGTGARAPSPQMLSHNNANFVMPRAPSPQLHVSTYNLGEIGPPRNQVARAPSPQLTMTNYMQDGGDYHAMTLGRKSSSNSLHHSTSSGYSSQHTTPTCSEDTIASHDTDLSSLDSEELPQQYRGRYDYEKYSTLPRNYHHGRAMEQLNRGSLRKVPNADVAIPTYSTNSNDVSRIATIRRKPSARFSTSTRTTRSSVPNVGAVANLLSTFAPPQSNGTSY